MAAWRYWRLYVTANNGDDRYTAFYQIELRGTAGGADLTNPATPSNQSSRYSTFTSAAKAINDDITTVSDGAMNAIYALPYWASYDLGSSASVAQFALWCTPVAAGPARAPKDFILQGSADNSTWTDEATFSNVTDWVIGTPKLFAIGGGGPVDTPVNPGVGAVSFTGYAPTVASSDNRAIEAGVGGLLFAGYAPTVVASNHRSVIPASGEIVFTGYPPTVFGSDNRAVDAGGGGLVFTGYPPTVRQGNDRTVDPGVGSVSFVGYPPVIDRTANVVVVAGEGSVSFVGYPPTVEQLIGSPELVPGAGYISFVGYPPSVRYGSPAAAEYPSKRLSKKKIIRTLAELNALVDVNELPTFDYEKITSDAKQVSYEDEDEEALMLLFA